ncbi:copper homeostasis periplasmic binding protein CopC [Neorhizobium sp. DAR64861/K0K2]|uniref:copper homeostasis periplasmic binding protein CopC n=1 Tax=unclassified Neorhizobium TaxID=2629175 RepID=UPI003D2A7AB8
MRSTIIASLAIAALMGAASQAAAHASVKSTTPTDKASVASPEELDLSFSEALNLPFSKLHLLGPDGKEIEIGKGILKDADKTLTAPVTGPLKPGTYTVKWNVLSVDGHKTNGTYTFTVKP